MYYTSSSYILLYTYLLFFMKKIAIYLAIFLDKTARELLDSLSANSQSANLQNKHIYITILL